MKAILLAAGEGKRMRPLTLVKPKTMIEVLGKPLLHHIIDSLPSEITELVIVIGYKGEAIKSYFGDRFESRPVTYVVQQKPLGTAHALHLCKNLIAPGEKFMFILADDLHSPEALKRLVHHQNGMLVQEHPEPTKFGVIEIDAHNRIVGIEEKPAQPKTNLVAVGAYMFDSTFFDYPVTPSARGEFEYVDAVKQMIKEQDVIIEKTEFWHPIGYPHDIEKAEEILAKRYPLPMRERAAIPFIIVAGGKGTRMPPEEQGKQKVLTDVAGKTLLQHQIEIATKQGFTNIRLALGYDAQGVINWLKKMGYDHITYVIEQEPLGTGGALKLAAKGITTPFIAINGDDIADVNYASLVRHGANGQYNVVTGMEISDARAYGLIAHDEFKRISAFKEKDPNATAGIVNIGHYYLKPDIFDGMPEKFSMEYDIFPKLTAKGELLLMKHMGNYWFGCGTPETLRLTREYFANSHK